MKKRRLSGDKAIAAQNELKAKLAQQESADIVFPEFSYQIEAQLFAEKGTGKVAVLHRLRYFAGPVENTFTGETELDASLFADDDTLKKFAWLVNNKFSRMFGEVLAHEAILHLNDVIHFTLNELGLDSIDLRGQAKAHARNTQKLVLDRMGVQKAGRAPQWQKYELGRAVVAILRKMPKKEQTYKTVAERLREQYGDKAPKSGDALRKMLEGHELDWQGLKNGLYS